MGKSKAPEITPEQVAAGVAKNAAAYNARIEALRSMKEAGTYNPPMDPQVSAKLAAEAARDNASLPAMVVGRDGGDVRMNAPDKQAEVMAKGKRGRNAKEQGENEAGQAGEGQAGDARVQARPPAFGFQARPEGHLAQAGHSDRYVGVGTEEIWVRQTFEAESKEALSELIPADAQAVTYKRVWKATALVRKV